MEINYNIPISGAFLHVTNNCNCKCKYCFEQHNSQCMTFQTAKNATNFLIENSKLNKDIPFITFFGGEPLLRWDEVIYPLIKYIRQDYGKPFSLSMTSNCILMDEKKLKFLKNNNVGLLFSLDGDKITQDYNRPLKNNQSSFDILKDKIPLILKYYPQMTFRSTIIPETAQYLFHNIKFAEQQGYKYFFTIPNEFKDWDLKDKKIVEKEIRKYSNYFIESFKQNKYPIIFSDFKKFFIKIQMINTAIARQENRNDNICGVCTKCGIGGSRYGAIGVDGKIYGCQELACDNMKKNIFYIGDIYNGIDIEKRKKLINSFNSKSFFGGEKCKTCKLNRVCDGGCLACNYLYSGNINIAPDTFCWWSQLLLNECIYICNSFGDNIPELFLNYWRKIHDGGRF